MDITNLLVAIASLVSGLGIAAAAIVAVVTLREQRHAQQRQTDLDNVRWLVHEWAALRPYREGAARSLINDTPSLPQLREVLNFLETCGYLVRQHLIDDGMLLRSIGAIAIRGWWHASADVVTSLRQRAQGATFWDDLEWLDEHYEPFLHDGPWLDGFLQRQTGGTIPLG